MITSTAFLRMWTDVLVMQNLRYISVNREGIFLGIFIIKAINSGLTATAINNVRVFLTTKKRMSYPKRF